MDESIVYQMEFLSSLEMPGVSFNKLHLKSLSTYQYSELDWDQRTSRENFLPAALYECVRKSLSFLEKFLQGAIPAYLYFYEEN